MGVDVAVAFKDIDDLEIVINVAEENHVAPVREASDIGAMSITGAGVGDDYGTADERR